jgi:hypothetical protein
MITTISNYFEDFIFYVRNFVAEFLHINNIISELNMLRDKIIQYENEKYEIQMHNNSNEGDNGKSYNLIYPPIDELLDYKWETFKFKNIIPKGTTTSQIQINLNHIGFKTNFATINGANHKMFIKVVDPQKKASWQTPWMDACNATNPDAMFPVDGTRCIYGIFSNVDSRVCYIGAETSHEAIFYIRIGIPIEFSYLKCKEITLKPVNKFKSKKL